MSVFTEIAGAPQEYGGSFSVQKAYLDLFYQTAVCSSEQFELSSAEYINTLKLLTVLKKVCEEE